MSEQVALLDRFSVFEKPEFHEVATALGEYLAILQVAGVAEYKYPIVVEAVACYLQHLDSKGLGPFAQVLLPPKVNPFIEKDGQGEYVLVADWESRHTQDHSLLKKKIIERIRSYQKGELGELWQLFGPMYSGKTGLLLDVIGELYDLGWKGSTHAFIASAMEEDHIVDRRGGRARYNPVENTRKLEATRLSVDNMHELLDNNPEIKPGDLVAIDEISFIAFDPEDVIELKTILNRLVAKGVFVIVTGLDGNYRMESLAMAEALANEHPGETEKFTAFAATRIVGDGVLVSVADSTFRINQGFGDFLLQVAIGRSSVVGRFLKYTVLPSDMHPFAVLREHYPQVYEQLIAIGEVIGKDQDLFNYYEQLAQIES